ncbi:hypothetical protein [Halonatronum saccharophilum]|uniref:hypothetical protein n=1 Tax=Halonatronum saccharophilum TaxID=150060 RepID=UPI0004852173|nr:hypothetical protein [Halonatronum saccharophilum]
MSLIFPGILASFLAFIINRYLVFNFGNKVIVYLIPLLEEVLKSGLYYIFGSSLILTHLIFGIIEGIFDYLDSRVAALTAVISHLLFGYITIYIWDLVGNLLVGVLVTILVHTIWNYLVGRMVI